MQKGVSFVSLLFLLFLSIFLFFCFVTRPPKAISFNSRGLLLFCFPKRLLFNILLFFLLFFPCFLLSSLENPFWRTFSFFVSYVFIVSFPFLDVCLFLWSKLSSHPLFQNQLALIIGRPFLLCFFFMFDVSALLFYVGFVLECYFVIVLFFLVLLSDYEEKTKVFPAMLVFFWVMLVKG